MSEFLYYLPGKDRNTGLVAIRAAGLGYAFDRQPTVGRVENFPPGGGPPGVVLADGDAVQVVAVQPDRQRWRKAPGAEHWVGMFTDAEPPGPGDLVRASPLPGHAVELADGKEWIVPTARAWSETEGGHGWSRALPGMVDLDDDGKWTVGDVEPRYAGLWQIAEQWYDTIAAPTETEDGDFLIDFGDVQAAAVTALQANYRIGPAGVVLLKLFTTQTAYQVLNALIDWPTVTRWLKDEDEKKKAGGSVAAT